MSARSSESVMTLPLLKKTRFRSELSKNRTSVPLSSAQHTLKSLTCTFAQQAHQQSDCIQVLGSRGHFMRTGARKLAFEVARKFRGQPGCEIAHQSFTGDLRQHSPQGVADRELDARRSALLCWHELVADLALRGRPAALIAAHADDPTGQIPGVALDPRGATETRGDRTEFDVDQALRALRGRRAGERRAGEAGGKACDIAEHVEDPLGRITDREMILKNLFGREVRYDHRVVDFMPRLGPCRRRGCNILGGTGLA